LIEFALLAFGLFIMLFGALGLIRFPDVYTRLHATAKCDTGGAMSILLALAVSVDAPAVVRFKFILLAFLIALINPMLSHAIARGAYKRGIKPKVVVDMYAGNNP